MLADTRARLLTALADPALPAGTVSNVLSSLAKVAIAIGELGLPPAPPPQVVFMDPACGEWPAVSFTIERSLVRLLELHADALAVLDQLDHDLARFSHQVATQTRLTFKHARQHFQDKANRHPFQVPADEPPPGSPPPG